MRPILDHREAVVPNAAHSLRERRRAMARRCRLFADQWGYACARVSLSARVHVRASTSRGLLVCVRAPMGACVWVCARECAHACSLGNEMRNQMPCLSLSSAEASPTRETLHYKICFSEHCRWSTRHILSNENRFRCCKSVGKRWCDVAGGLLTLGFRSHRCLHACWRGMVMGPIFDCRETAMGPCPWRRTASRVALSDGAMVQAVCLPWVSGHRCS